MCIRNGLMNVKQKRLKEMKLNKPYLICPISFFLKTRQNRLDFHHAVLLYGLVLFLTLLDNVLSLDNVSNNHWTMCSIIIGQCVQ